MTARANSAPLTSTRFGTQMVCQGDVSRQLEWGMLAN
jgi:hypothetical protein